MSFSFCSGRARAIHFANGFIFFGFLVSQRRDQVSLANVHRVHSRAKFRNSWRVVFDHHAQLLELALLRDRVRRDAREFVLQRHARFFGARELFA